MNDPGTEPVILLLENGEDDVFFFRRALSALQFPGHLSVARNEREAREYMEGTGKYGDRRYSPLPDLIISDFSLPGKTGIEFLQWLRTQPQYNEIPFILFSGSASPTDREAALLNGAVTFFSKTGDFAIMRERVAQALAYLEQVPRPRRPPGPDAAPKDH